MKTRFPHKSLRLESALNETIFTFNYPSSQHRLQQLTVNCLCGAHSSVREQKRSDEAENGVGHGHGGVDGQVEVDVTGRVVHFVIGAVHVGHPVREPVFDQTISGY